MASAPGVITIKKRIFSGKRLMIRDKKTGLSAVLDGSMNKWKDQRDDGGGERMSHEPITMAVSGAEAECTRAFRTLPDWKGGKTGCMIVQKELITCFPRGDFRRAFSLNLKRLQAS